MTMRGIVIVGVLAACGSGSKKGGAAAAQPPETATGPGAAGLLACQSTVRALDAFVACAPNEDERLVAAHFQESMRGVITSSRPLDGPGAGKLTARMCLGFLEGMALDLEAKRCAFALTPDERAWLDAERRRRTPIPDAAKGTDRVALQVVVTLRDRACACTTVACVDAIDAELEAKITPLSREATLAVRDAAGEIIDETQACARRVRTRAGLAEPSGPGDPAAVKRLADQIRAERAATIAAANRPPPPPLALPDGKTLRLADCAAHADADARSACEFLFDDVAECQTRGTEAKACVDAVVKEYVEWTTSGHDGAVGFEDDEDGAAE